MTKKKRPVMNPLQNPKQSNEHEKKLTAQKDSEDDILATIVNETWA